jgi:hypothetical protein
MKRQRKVTSGFFNEMDITHALHGWSFEPGQVNVRLIRGNDGRAKLQLRLDLGLLQMEIEGRPDGKRPHRAPTELDFQKRKLISHKKKYGSDAGFHLAARDCQSLREESAMFYHRYLSMFVLEQYEAVIRDTQHNIDVLELCSRYGRNDYDRNCLEQYRPYILMMNTRAKACESLRQGYVQTAIAYLRGGIRRIAHMMPREERKKLLRQSNEAKILLDMLKQIRAQLPPDPRAVLQRRLNDAVAAEKFEEAAALRDQLMAMKEAIMNPPHESSRVEDPRPGDASMPSPMPSSARPKAKRARKPRQRKADSAGEGESSGK